LTTVKPLAAVNGGMASLATLLVDSHLNAARSAEPVELAQKFVPIHLWSIG